jgi:hypothetical protein
LSINQLLAQPVLTHVGMKTTRTAIIALLLITFLGVGPWEPWANAERLQKSELDSTLQSQCDLCWYPTPDDPHSNRLPAYKRQRPRRPPDSRPHRIPKGGYTLVPHKKQTRSSLLRARARPNARLVSTPRIFVIDGDTIRVGSERIRLRGIDAPELSEPEGQAAKERLEELLRTGPIQVIPHGRDVYDRLVADVFVDGQNVAEILKSEGFAKPR